MLSLMEKLRQMNKINSHFAEPDWFASHRLIFNNIHEQMNSNSKTWYYLLLKTIYTICAHENEAITMLIDLSCHFSSKPFTWAVVSDQYFLFFLLSLQEKLTAVSKCKSALQLSLNLTQPFRKWTPTQRHYIIYSCKQYTQFGLV